jgi:hypothetical protein
MNRSRAVYSVVAIAGIGLGAFYLTRNRPPEPMDDHASVAEAQSIEVAVLGNDIDRDGDGLKVVSVAAPRHGVAAVSPDGRVITYTPAPQYYGADRFKYRVADPAGAEAEASVNVSVQFQAPTFHRRSTSPTLAEMLQEPPSSVYGSTINVFLYRNATGELREISISGHADSLTCQETSGAFAGALIDAGPGSENFLIAGAGRMVVPDLDPVRTASLEEDAEVKHYTQLKTQLELLRLLVSRGVITAEAAEKRLGKSLDATRAVVDELSKVPSVAEYLAQVHPRQSAQTFARQARELEESTGMLRVHEVPFDRIQAVKERLKAAATSGKSTILKFSDLLPGSSEAVIYTPVLKLGSGEELTLTVSLRDFSPQGFQHAAKIHRSALENAIVGSARKRLAHAESFLKRSETQRDECSRMTRAELVAPIQGRLQTCDRDGCEEDLHARHITNQEYCFSNVPRNLEAGKEWKEEAERVLQRVKQFQERQNDDQIDALTHAALVDSMLRDWALPIPKAQAAFDFWRKQGRGLAWKAITDAMSQGGVGRAALSGESIVFNVSLAGDMLSIRPLLVIDLARTTVLVDKTLGVTAALSSWELRRSEPDTPLASSARNEIEHLIQDPHEWARRVRAAPEASISGLLEALLAELPPEGPSWSSQMAEVERMRALQMEELLNRSVSESLAQPAHSQEDAWKRLLELDSAGYAARYLPSMSQTFRLRAAASIAQQVLALKDAKERDGWGHIKRIFAQGAGQQPVAEVDRVDRVFFGQSSTAYLHAIIDRARIDNPERFKEMFAAPAAPSPGPGAALSPQPILTHVVDLAERTRSALTFRAVLDEVLAAFDDDGSVSTQEIRSIVARTNLDNVWHGPSWHELRFMIRYYSEGARRGRINPIEGNKLVSIIANLQTALDNEMRGIEPRLSAFRFGRDQEIIVARLLFDKGAYAAALDRLAPSTVPLSLYTPAIKWVPLAPSLRGVPESLSLRAQDGHIIVAATVRGVPMDVIRFEGIDARAREMLVSAKPRPPTDWNDGDPLWQQVLLAEVPAPHALTAARKALASEAARPSALKAMVYACAVPGRHLLAREGRCKSAEGSASLHDRIDAKGGIRFVTPELEETQARTMERFFNGAAWRPGAPPATR